MKFDAIAFRDRFLRAYEASTFKSIRQLSLASGFSESHLHKIANGAYDNSTSGPGCFGLARVALSLNTSPDHLLGFQRSAPPRLNEGPSTARMFRCYLDSGARMEGFQEMMNFCDVYSKPRDGLTHLEKVGRLSLLAQTSKIIDPEILQREFEAAEPELREAVFEGQLRAWNAGALAEPYFMNRRLVSRALHVRLPFIRVACRVSTLSGEEKLLIFCERLEQ